MENKITNKMGMFAANYAACCLLSLFYLKEESIIPEGDGLAPVLILGGLSGILYLVNFIFLKYNMQYNGIVLSSTFMKLGVLIPTIMAVICFGEKPGAAQVIGIAIAVVAIIVFNFEKDAVKDGERKHLLILLLLLSGFTDSMAKIFEQAGNVQGSDAYLLVTFFVAFVIAMVMAIRNKNGISREDVKYGLLIGIPNYYSARFLLQSLQSVDAVLVYPLYSVATIIVVTIAGVFLFHEKLSGQKAKALVLVLVAVCLLNM